MSTIATFNRGLVLLLMLLLTACETPLPTPFEPGQEVRPPIGCIEYRERGGQC